jgi:probable lipoprotein LpqN
MRPTAMSWVATVAAALAIVLSGCGSGTKTAPSTSTSVPNASSATTSAKAAPSSKPKVAPREADKTGPNPTIANYIQQNNIQETPVKKGDSGSPTIDLPVPDGWELAGADTPDWAYAAIVYKGREGEEYPPSIVALVSKLTGNVDPQKIIDLAPGELQNLPGWKASNKGEASSLGEYRAYQLSGTWTQDDQTKIVAQKTVVIPGRDGLYVLQLNADGLEDQGGIVSAANTVIDDQTKITP